MSRSDKTTDHDHNRTTSLDEVLAAYAELEANAGTIDCEAFIAKYPALETELREFFNDKDMLDEFVRPEAASGSGSNQLTEMFTGSLLGRFELRREHARGGLGKVWKAHDPVLRREVALKEIREEQAQNPIARHRFLREAQVTGQLEHPNIVPVHELGRDSKDDRLFYTMRFVQGDTLRDVIQQHHRKFGRRAPQASRRLLNKFVSICEAMAYAHARGVVHRDLKPHNVAIGEFGEVVVMDWGLAKIGDKDDDSAQSVGISSEADGQATVAGHAMGTPAYMAPEQAAGRAKDINSRTDVYGLGAILFEILTGSAPHRGPTTDAILQAILHRETPTTRDRLPTVPKPLDAICAKAMAKQGSDRYNNAIEFARDIQHWLDDEPISVCPESLLRRAGRWQRRNRSLVAMALMFALLVGSCIGWLSAAARERLREQLLQQTADAAQQRDDIRYSMFTGDRQAGLATCDAMLSNEMYMPSYLQSLLAASNAQTRDLSNSLLSTMSEVALLKVRALLTPHNGAENPDDLQAAEQTLEMLDRWNRAPQATQLFRTFFMSPTVESDSILDAGDSLVAATPLDSFLLGEVFRYRGDNERAIVQYDATLRQDPSHFWAQLMIGICQFELGQSTSALAAFDQAARLKPEYSWVFASRALALADHGKWELAHADLDRAESHDPTYFGTANNRGIIWYTQATRDRSADVEQRKKWLNAAIEEFTKANGLHPSGFANAYNNSGLAAMELARIAQSQQEPAADIDVLITRAHDAFGTAITLGVNEVAARVNRAALLAEFRGSSAAELSRAKTDLQEARREAKKLSGIALDSALRSLEFGDAYIEALVAERLIKSAKTPDEIAAAGLAVDKALDLLAKVVPDQQDVSNEQGMSSLDDHFAREARLARVRLRYELFELYANADNDLVTNDLISPLGTDFYVLTTLGASRLTDRERAELFKIRAKVEDWLHLKRDAMLNYARAIEADPTNASLYLHRGKLLVNARSQALLDFEQAINVETPSSENRLTRAMAYGNRAYVLALDAQADEAVQAADSALELASDNWRVQFQAALAFSLCITATEPTEVLSPSQEVLANKAIESLNKTLELLQQSEAQWTQKWPPLLKDSGFDVIRDREGFPELLP